MFYSDGSEAGLVISPVIHKRLKDSIDICIACTQEPAPPGIEQRRAMAKWAQERVKFATISDAEDARRWTALNKPLVDCAACMSQLHRVIGVPINVLVPLVSRLRQGRRADLIGFLQTRLVFVMCEGCASRAAEEEQISAPEIEQRYKQMQLLIAGTTQKPPPEAVRQFNELMEEIRDVIHQLRGVA